MRLFLLCCFCLIIEISFGQATNPKFEKFAIKQDSLCKLAYKQKDILSFNKLLKEFLNKYNKLSETDQKEYTSYLASNYYNLCCTYALLGNKTMALDYLKKSVDAGFYDYGHIMEDTDLKDIRDAQAFKEIVDPLRNIGDYLYILQNAGRYNVNDNRELPKFTYQSADNPNLVALRKGFNLDSIAGQGADYSRIINLMHWVHYLIPHDGQHSNPETMNAMNIISACKLGKRGLNCRGLATVLNECYLSLGIKSRIVTCLPKDSLKKDFDCHVINLVYSDTLQKWLWMDPTNDAYIMDEKGNLLNIEEVRERVVNNMPVIVNPDANWNRRMSVSKEDYLYHYMAKNMYMLQCPVHSEYNMETTVNGKVYSYITLLPLAYYDQKFDKREEKSTNPDFTRVTYQTNNPKLFWEKP